MKKNLFLIICWMLEATLIFSLFQSFERPQAAYANAMPETAAGVIAYVRPLGGVEDQIRLIDPDGQNDRFLWSSGKMSEDTGLRIVKNLAWKPDGSELSFDSSHLAGCSQYRTDVYSIRPDGSDLRRIPYKPYCGQDLGLPTGTVEVTFINTSSTSSAFILYFEGAPAPQSRAIASGTSVTVTFQDVVDYGNVKQYAVAMWGGTRSLSAEGYADVIPGQTVQVDHVMSYGYDSWANYSATWNYDGTEIAYYFMKDTNPFGIAADDRTLGADGSYLLLPESNYWDLPSAGRYLAYGPTKALADKLLYAGYNPIVNDGGDHIYMATVGQLEPGEIILNATDLYGDNFKGLAWLPDGSGFVFSMEEDFTDRANIFHYSFATGQSTRLTDYPTGVWTRALSVSPDGTQIVYELQAEGEYWWDNPPMDLYMMNIDGSGNRLFVAGGRSPDWGVKYVASNNPVPALAGISPSTVNKGGAGFTLTANGSSFVNGSVIRWNGAALATTYVNATKLTAQVPADKIAAAGTANVTVFNPAPGGGVSGAKTFTITGSDSTNPVPAVTSLNPSAVSVGGAGFTLTVNGSSFVNGSVVRWNGSALATTYVNASTLTAQVPADKLAAAGTVNVTVSTPAPGGGESAVMSFQIFTELQKTYLPLIH